MLYCAISASVLLNVSRHRLCVTANQIDTVVIRTVWADEIFHLQLIGNDRFCLTVAI